jgi:hypothetical protein
LITFSFQCGVRDVFGPARGLDARDQLLHVLDLVFGRDEHGVGGLDDHDILEAERRDEPAVGVYVAAARVLEQHVAARDVAGRVRGQHFVQRGPRADVAPAGVEGDHDGVAGFFHDGVVDGVAAAGSERGFVDAREILVVHGARAGARANVRDIGRESREFFEVAARGEHEGARVPEVVARRDEFPRLVEARLFHEFFDGRDTVTARVGALEVAVAGFGGARDDAERDELAVLGRRHRARDRGLERGQILEHVVRGQHEQQRIVAALLRQHRVRGDRDGRRRIAPGGLEQDAARRETHLAELLGDEETMGFVADDQRARRAGKTREPRRGLLDHGSLAGEREQLLGEQFTRQRPQAGTRAAGEDHRHQFHGQIVLRMRVSRASAPHGRSRST